MNTYIEANLAFLGAVGSATVATSESTTSTSYTDLTTVGPSVTATTQTTALIIFNAYATQSTQFLVCDAGVAVSGATTIAAAAGTGIFRWSPANNGGASSFAAAIFIPGLTPGSNVFTMKYAATLGGTATFANRNLLVIPMTV